MTTLVVVVIVTPVSFTMSLVIDSVAVLVCVGPMIAAAFTDNATRNADERCQGA